MKKIIFLIFAVFLGGCSAYDEAAILKESKKDIQLGVGQEYHISVTGYRYTLTYAGMVNNEVFSVSSLNGRRSVTLYFPISVETITVQRILYKIISVSPDTIIVKVVDVV